MNFGANSLNRWKFHADFANAANAKLTGDCTFWYTTEDLESSGTFNWSTWIASFKFPGCV